MSEITLDAAVQMAANHLNARRFGEAENVCRQVLAAYPGQPDTMHLSGIACLQTNRLPEGIEWIEKVIATGKVSADVLVNLAVGYRMAGNVEGVLKASQAGLRLDPDHVELIRMQAVARLDLGRFEEAIEDWRRLTEKSSVREEAWSNLGVTYERLGRLTEAEAACRQSIAVNPNYAPGHNNLAATLAAQGRLEEALVEHRAAVNAAPRYAPAWLTMAHTAQLLGKLDEAAAAARMAVAIQPDNVDAHRNLAAVLQELGEIDAAVASYDQAAGLLRTLLPSLPAGSLARRQAGDLLTQILLVSATILPQVYESARSLQAWRDRVRNAVGRLRADGLRADVSSEPMPTLFALAYQGQDDRAIAEEYGSLVIEPTIPALSTPHMSGRRVRVGFVSRFLCDHTIGRLNLGLVQHLDRSGFEVSVFPVGDPRDVTSQLFRLHADQYEVLPPQLRAAREILASARQDVLFYTDLGMDPVTYSLAYARLAPVQMTTWGHPVTSGIPNVDYFLSAEALETAGSEAQYTEKLARLPGLSVYYHRPKLEGDVSRNTFGLEDSWTLYGSLQMLWKFHPDFDDILAGVLRRDPAGRLLLIRGMDKRWDDQLLARWRRVMPDVADRILFLPRMSRTAYLALTSVLDVSLDPIHFCGGNTSYEALALNVPVVTMPSQFLRGRLTHAMYHAMGVTDFAATSPADYVDRAVTLATDASVRIPARAALADRVGVLFENHSAVRDLEAFLSSLGHS